MKIDNYRIFRLLDAIRKGLYWNNVNYIDNFRREQLFLQYNNEIKELESLSNLIVTLTVFSTSLFISILQLLKSLSDYYFNNYWRITTIVFAFSSLCIIIFYIVRKHIINKRIRNVDKQVLTLLERESNDIRISEKENTIQSFLIELEILDELGNENVEKAKNNKISKTELDSLVTKISDKINSIKNNLEVNIESLRKEQQERENKGE